MLLVFSTIMCILVTIYSAIHIDEDKVPKIAGIDESSTAYRFAVKTFGREYFVELGDYNPYEKEDSISLALS